MIDIRKEVRASELPICPFCQGLIYYDQWITHRIFQMECKQCKAHWRTGILHNDNREMYVELVKSKNPEISNEYMKKKLSLQFWQNMVKKPNE
jgi:hypothetical protein